MKNKHSITAWIAITVVLQILLIVPVAPGDMVPGAVTVYSATGFHQGDNLTGDGSIETAINGRGLTVGDPGNSATWTHSNAWQDDWQGFATTGWMVLDLGSEHDDLGTMYLWNVNEANHTDRGVRTYDVYYATSPTDTPPPIGGTVQAYNFSGGGWTQLEYALTLERGDGTGANRMDGILDLSSIPSARYIGFNLVSNYGAGDRVGLGEVQISTEQLPAIILSLFPADGSNVTGTNAFPLAVGADILDFAETVDTDSIEMYVNGTNVIVEGDVSKVSTTTTVSHVYADSTLLLDGTNTVDLVYATVESASPVTNSWTFILPYDPGYGIYIRDTTAPVPDDYDISQFTASTTDAGNVGLGDGDDAATYIAHDRSAQGQTFTTGEESVYELTSVWVRHVQGYDTWSVFDFGDTDRLRITDPSQAGTTNFVIYSELLTVVDDAAGSMVGTPINGTGYWIEYRLQNPVLLNGGTQYGFDISTDSAESGEFFEIAGVVANAYDGGSAYSSGATGFGSDNLDTVWDGDRTFLVDLSIPGASVVPEIQSLSIADDSATLVWDSEPGVTYRILRRSAMSSGDWTEAKAGIEGTGETTVDSVSLTGQNHEFYRIEGN